MPQQTAIFTTRLLALNFFLISLVLAENLEKAGVYQLIEIKNPTSSQSLDPFQFNRFKWVCPLVFNPDLSKDGEEVLLSFPIRAGYEPFKFNCKTWVHDLVFGVDYRGRFSAYQPLRFSKDPDNPSSFVKKIDEETHPDHRLRLTLHNEGQTITYQIEKKGHVLASITYLHIDFENHFMNYFDKKVHFPKPGALLLDAHVGADFYVGGATVKLTPKNKDPRDNFELGKFWGEYNRKFYTQSAVISSHGYLPMLGLFANFVVKPEMQIADFPTEGKYYDHYDYSSHYDNAIVTITEDIVEFKFKYSEARHSYTWKMVADSEIPGKFCSQKTEVTKAETLCITRLNEKSILVEDKRRTRKAVIGLDPNKDCCSYHGTFDEIK